MNKSDRPPTQHCECHQLDDMVIIDMGWDTMDIFRRLEQIRKRGLPWWWLSVYRCRVCQQWWLVAQEERQNDIFCLRKLTGKEIEQVLNNNVWPDDFDRYEQLLRIGAEAGKRVRFIDPLNSSLVYTVADIAKEHPRITIPEIAYLLNLDTNMAEEIARIVVAKDDVEIDFEK